MSSPIEHELIERVHASGMHILLSITGGGSRAIASLLEVPGASSSIVGAIVPYAPTALESWLGGAVDQHCSERTSRAMAMTAFGRARQFCDADPRTLRGIGATASLASTRPKRGPHRIHVAWQSAEATVSYSCELVKGERTRAEEEMVATQLILTAVCEACGVDGSSLVEPSVAASVRRREQHAPAAWTQLLLGERTSVAIHDEDSPVLFPGAFNPLHEGHLQMAEVARAHYSMPVTFELSITNVDKAPLDFIELADRLKPLADRSVLLTRAPTFVEKAKVVPGCVFVVGMDTLIRIADLRYYGGDALQRDDTIATIANQGCRFLVFGRMVDEQFVRLSDVELPIALRELCEDVPESLFRTDLSSTDLRASQRTN